MPIKPLDLQTLFVKMSQVGKEQSHIKNAAAVQQSLRGQEISREELKKDHQVNESSEDTESGKVKDDQKNASQGEGKDESGGLELSDEMKRKKEVFSDPDMGQHVDISG